MVTALVGVDGRPTRAVRRFAGTGAAAIGCGTVALVVMHVLPGAGTLDPVSVPLSVYALTGVGWLFDIAVLMLAVGVLGVTGAVVLAGHGWIDPPAFCGLNGCAVGMVALVVFPVATIGGRLTTIGWLHVIASLLAFGGPPLACIRLGLRHRRLAGCSKLPALAGWLAVGMLGWFAVAAAGAVLEWAGNVPVWHIGGVIERGLTATEIAAALALAAWAWRGCPCRAITADACHWDSEPGAGDRFVGVGQGYRAADMPGSR